MLRVLTRPKLAVPQNDCQRKGVRVTELSKRKELILSAIVEFYIATGEPSGSKLIVTALPFAVSSATVRNEMAELSEMGYLEQPHTSAGRIPSDKGLRYYADRLLRSFSPASAEIFRVLSTMDHSEGDAKRILTSACDILAELTGAAAVAATPRAGGAVIRNVQVMPVGGRSVLVAVSTSAGILKSRIAKLEKPADYPLLELFYNVAAANFTGAPCGSITRAKLQSITASLGARALDIAPLLVSLTEAVNESAQPDMILRGTGNLLNSVLRADAPQIIELAGRGEEFLPLLGDPAEDSVQLRIGRENKYACLRNTTLITAGYRAGADGAGVIGVIGPTKLDYAHTIPLVKYVGTVVGKLISDNLDAGSDNT